jgi:hypothetical protein
MPPEAICPYYEVDPVQFRQLGNTAQERRKFDYAMKEVKKRTGLDYFRKTCPLQGRTLDYSARSFPAYRFILPDVMTEDWLAIVDWGKFQRDHVLHQPLCGYVVLKLLDGDGKNGPLQLPNGKTILDMCVDWILKWKGTAYIRDFLIRCGMKKNDPILQTDSPIARSVWRAFFREAAYVATVFHDLGYPWQYAELLQGNLDGINSPTLRQNRSATQVVRLFGQRLLFQALQGYQTPDPACPSTWNDRITRLTDLCLSKTHGFPGALGFLHLNDCIRRYPSPKESPLHLLCVEWAATAIMMHDMIKIYWGADSSGSGVPENPFLRLSFDRDPLSAIVTLTDVIQDFERPTVSFGTSRDPTGEQELVTLQYNKACLSTDLELNSTGVMTLKYQMADEIQRATKRTRLPKENHQHFDAHYGFLDMSGLGINKVQMVSSC